VGKLIYRVLGISFTVPLTLLTRKVLDKAWRTTQGHEPPRNPRAPDARLSDVLAWAGLSGLTLAIGQFTAARAAAAAYRALTGRHAPGWAPPAVEPPEDAAE
jgi:hypothetical protein